MPTISVTQIACAALLFDMDGVLIDSTPAVERVWRGWAIEHGFDPVEVTRAAHGRPSLTTVREYLKGGDPLAENREIERREIEDTEGIVALPGAMELLTSLPQGRWAIVTSCTRPLAEVRLRAAGLPRPGIVITSSDVKNGKPAPEPYLKAAEALGFAARDCIVVEDAPAGVQAGKAAGARVIGLSTITDDADLREHGADWTVKNCAAVSIATPPVKDGKLLLDLRLASAAAPAVRGGSDRKF
ncbi:MAG TPA: HAD family hydrolase [Candidatus Limnocylindrales bacterium]|nr:HAD family hydrolase [Candidatus Limnocylindrales bacterium]